MSTRGEGRERREGGGGRVGGEARDRDGSRVGGEARDRDGGRVDGEARGQDGGREIGEGHEDSEDSGPNWSQALSAVLLRLLLGWLPMIGVLAGVGTLLTGPLADDWPLTAEDEVNAGLVADRTAQWNAVTDWFTAIGNTLVVIATCALAALALRRLLGRWREALFVVAATWTQSVVFLSTTVLIERERPEVPRLDPAPPTSSFPSGHTAATAALYGALALVLVWHVRRRWAVAAALLIALVPPAMVLYARLYRGMHHPSDVAGSLLLAGLCLLLAWHAVLHARLPRSEEPVDGPDWDQQRRAARPLEVRR